ncbi:cellulose synthase operon protein YhjU [Cupriavidus gilardii J11]|uniref:Cellulose synthase operon protein YhjU n=1 Tax=Cupriavidus gilardii J11 TaxID=936133 RepID=A0A562BPA3_9BURK|nr:cellulose biosynthesis protein BcsG [Cupriavidus gilardii]TWG86740.1 cellulose synthase operon protein YhjU [Cupriavidus gilardii J11]
MGIWNLYFAAKLYLFAIGQVQPRWLLNLLFALVLVLPLRQRWLRVLRQCVAVIVGCALLYHESNLPPFARVLSQMSNLSAFTPGYLLELLQRFISPQMALAAIVATLAYFVINRWVRVTTFVLIALIAVPLWRGLDAVPTGTAATRPVARIADTARIDDAAEAGDNDAQLAAFRAQEANRRVSFTPVTASPSDQFDIIVLHICSLSWDDLDVAKARNHPLLSRFDYLFSNFSSAASYSGPAAIRLLRASCGQQAHQALYQSAPAECHLFAALAQAGFTPQVLMNHDGRFDNFRGFVDREMGIPGIVPQPVDGVPTAMRAFDNSPILGDYAVFEKWYKNRLTQNGRPVALYYNTVTLHDGNRLPNSRLTSIESYPVRLASLLNDIDRMIELISRSGRKAVVVFVPEHGAALRGDANQIAGMREIPTPGIVHVPVGVKLIGLPHDARPEPLTVSAPTSYLGLAQLVANMVADSPFREGAPAPAQYAAGLPQTRMVAENEATVMMKRGNGYMIRTPDGVWVDGK